MRKRLDSNKRIVYVTSKSRQYEDQLRYKSLGLCIKCQKPQASYSKNYCAYHVNYAREMQRKRNACKKRNTNCNSYIAERGQ
jgi:hypothetical protein